MITQSLAPADLPPDERVYAIGDVHGCLDQLVDLHAQIARDLAARPVAKATLVHLGDYIDRGPDSAGVLARLLAPPPDLAAATIVNLMGNHEAMLLAALDGERGAAANWLHNGGVAALESWGVRPRASTRDWVRTIPPEHIALMRGLAIIHRQGGYLFVHAGIRPGIALEAQSREDMLWIRETFLGYAGRLPCVVVHGHTPEDTKPVVTDNRIGIDTGAVLGGVLSCVVLEGASMGFLHA